MDFEFDLSKLKLGIPFKELGIIVLISSISIIFNFGAFDQDSTQYIFMALQAQFKQGPDAYRIGDAQELTERRQQGFKFLDFNPEQQGKLNETFFVALNHLPDQQEMYDACLPYVSEERGLV